VDVRRAAAWAWGFRTHGLSLGPVEDAWNSCQVLSKGLPFGSCCQPNSLVR
jgi:hypothetical protein